MGTGQTLSPSTRKVWDLVVLWTDPCQLNFSHIFFACLNLDHGSTTVKNNTADR